MSDISTPDPAPEPPPVPPPVLPPVSGAAPVIASTKDERLWVTVIHLSGLIGGFLAAMMIPGNVLLPLILWLIKREGSPFIDDQGKEAVNFQITMTLAACLCFILSFVCIGIPLLIAVAVFALVVEIIAAIQSNSGAAYRYPLNIRIIK